MIIERKIEDKERPTKAITSDNRNTVVVVKVRGQREANESKNY